MSAQDDARPLLQTKLFIPRRRRGQVERPRLLERMSRGTESRLTLVSAPAGFGKTTLLAEWLDSAPDDGRSTAWVSLDSGDRQVATFWSYVIAALQTVAPDVGANSLAMLLQPQPQPIESVLAPLVNELSATSRQIILVLDDYQVIDSPDLDRGLAFLLEHLPPQVHVVIATRADPALPLARLRGRAELVEIRAADLRFTPGEALAYLNDVMDLGLTAPDVAALEERTEGWIAALQLAALSVQGRDDVAGFIDGFAGDDRYIVDYLVEEVLQRQPDRVRSFLLQTSILGRLSGPLVDAVTEQDGGKATLEALERANLFLVPLDDRRRWYRYHQLFADVLQARLADERPDEASELHRRASDWYERNGERSEAVRHAIAGTDFERAAELIEREMPSMRSGRQDRSMLGWLEALPDEVIADRPVLSAHFAGELLDRGHLEGVEAHLVAAERWLATTADGGAGPAAKSSRAVVVDEAEYRRLPGRIAIYRTAQAHLNGDVAGTIRSAQLALELIGGDDDLGRGSAAGLLALAYWTKGDLDAAHGAWADAMASLHKAGHVADAVGCAIALADIRIAQGRDREAMSTYERGLRLATGQRGPVVRGAADMHVGMSERLRERDDLVGARAHLTISTELGEHASGRQNPYRWRVAMARIRVAEGELDEALDLLDEAGRLYVADFYPIVRPIHALKVRIWIAQGRLDDANGWAREQGLSAQDELDYVREFEHITLARILVARAKRSGAHDSLTPAIAFLERLRRAADDGGRIGSVIEILVVEAIAHQVRGDVPAALASLARCLPLAEPEARVRVFLDEGPSVAALLEAMVKRGTAPIHARELLVAFGRGTDRSATKQGLIESLSDRELEVLRILATDLDGPDIARELVVSLSTIRSHTKAIYSKLGVNSRRSAVHRGQELGLLAAGDNRPRNGVIGDA